MQVGHGMVLVRCGECAKHKAASVKVNSERQDPSHEKHLMDWYKVFSILAVGLLQRDLLGYLRNKGGRCGSIIVRSK